MSAEKGGDAGARGRLSKADREAAELAHQVAQRAIRRLDVLEWVMFIMAAGLAAGGGAVVAWILSTMGDWDFRSTWIGASLLLFVVPGAIAIIKIRRDERADALRREEKRESSES